MNIAFDHLLGHFPDLLSLLSAFFPLCNDVCSFIVC